METVQDYKRQSPGQELGIAAAPAARTGLARAVEVAEDLLHTHGMVTAADKVFKSISKVIKGKTNDAFKGIHGGRASNWSRSWPSEASFSEASQAFLASRLL